VPPVQQPLSDHRHCDPIATNKAFFPVSYFRADQQSRTINQDSVKPHAQSPLIRKYSKRRRATLLHSLRALLGPPKHN
jgi:hypothetical protein